MYTYRWHDNMRHSNEFEAVTQTQDALDVSPEITGCMNPLLAAYIFTGVSLTVIMISVLYFFVTCLCKSSHAKEQAWHKQPLLHKSLYTYLLTPWSRVLVEKLTGSAASQEIPCIFGTRRFLTVLTSVPILSLLHPVPTTPSHFLNIHLNIILTSTSGSPQWSLSLRFPHQNPVIFDIKYRNVTDINS